MSGRGHDSNSTPSISATLYYSYVESFYVCNEIYKLLNSSENGKLLVCLM